MGNYRLVATQTSWWLCGNLSARSDSNFLVTLWEIICSYWLKLPGDFVENYLVVVTQTFISFLISQSLQQPNQLLESKTNTFSPVWIFHNKTFGITQKFNVDFQQHYTIVVQSVTKSRRRLESIKVLGAGVALKKLEKRVTNIYEKQKTICLYLGSYFI